MSASVVDPRASGTAGRSGSDLSNGPADPDSDLPGTGEIAAVIRLIQAELSKVHPSEVEYIADLRADLEILAQEMAERVEELEAVNLWQDKAATDPLAADLTGLLLEAKSDDDVFAVMRGISERFRAAHEPEPIPEPELSEMVPDILPNNAFSGFQDARKAAQRVNPWMRERIATHEDPLGQRVKPEPPKLMTTRQDGEEYQRELAREQMRADGMLRELTGGAGGDRPR